LIDKIYLEPAFVLHSRPYQETSLIIDFFTKSYGRLNAVAKGAKRPKSPLRSVLTPACKLVVSMTGKSELKNLSSVEIVDHFNLRDGISLNSIIYINELISKATEKEDPHENIFLEYEILLRNLNDSKGSEQLEKSLRNFELNLLQEMGYGIDLTREAESNMKIDSDTRYRFDPDKGFSSINENDSTQISFLGQDVLDFSQGQFEKKTTRDASKIIMRLALDYHLGNKTLNIRKYLTKN
tara:strand:+ start:119 stop:835 length:717 start_codon:yes stop_codon:yes gene_type:complete